MAAPEVSDAVPLWQQAVAAIIGLSTFVGMVVNAIRTKKDDEAHPPASHVVMETASVADTRPFKDLLNQLIATGERNARANEAILEAMREWIDEEKEIRKAAQQEIHMREYITDALKRAEEDRLNRIGGRPLST